MSNIENLLKESGISYREACSLFFSFENGPYAAGTNEKPSVLLDFFGKTGFLAHEAGLVIFSDDGQYPLDCVAVDDIGKFVRELVEASSVRSSMEDWRDECQNFLDRYGINEVNNDLRFLGIDKEGMFVHVGCVSVPGGPVDEIYVIPQSKIVSLFLHPYFQFETKKAPWHYDGVSFSPEALRLVAEKEPEIACEGLAKLFDSGIVIQDMFYDELAPIAEACGYNSKALGDLREHAFAACIARERNYADKRVSWVKERAGEKEDEFVMEENVIPF